MKPKILIITNIFLYDFIVEMEKDLNSECKIEIATYNHFEDIPSIYASHRNQVDAFLISGKIALASLEKSYPNHKEPIYSFEADALALYRQLTNLFVLRKDLDTNRVVMDFLLLLDKNATVDFFLKHADFDDLDRRITKWIDSATVDEFSVLEQTVLQEIIRLWNEKKIDFVICEYGSIVPTLQELGIPYQYIAPTKELLQYHIHSLLDQIQLVEMRDNLPAVVAIADSNYDSEALQKLGHALVAINKEHATNYILQEEQKRYYIYTSSKIINLLTNNHKNSFFQLALKNNFQIHAAVGYGIGTDISIAKANAETALKESLFSDESYIINEDRHLIGPLGSEQSMEVTQDIPDQISKIASDCMLSTLTIRKLITVLTLTHSNLITAQNLATHLGVSVRNANRILNHLQKGGYASIVYTQSSATKGRPVKVYELKIHVDYDQIFTP